VGFSALRGGQKCGIFSSEGGNFAVQDLATLVNTRKSEQRHCKGQEIAKFISIFTVAAREKWII